MPEAGPFILCDIRNTGLTGSQFVELALLDAGVALVDGGRFGRSTEGFVRAALTRPEDVLVKAGRRLGALFHRLRGDGRQRRRPLRSPRRGGGPILELADAGYSALRALLTFDATASSTQSPKPAPSIRLLTQGNGKARGSHDDP